MWLKFEGGSSLQRQWFLEAARSLEGELSWGEVYSHSAYRDWLDVIEGYPIFDWPIYVEVDWTGDPDPGSHNEWAYTENMETTWEQVGDALVAGSPNAGATLHSLNGGDFGSYTYGEVVLPSSRIEIKSDLHTKGEELYKYVVRHELGHVIMHSLSEDEMLNLANAFNVPVNSAGEAADWFAGEGLTWAQRGKESVAETVADIFWLGPDRGPGRYATNRTRYRLQSEAVLDDFVSILAPPLGGFTDFSTPPPHPKHPYAQNSEDPPESSSRSGPVIPEYGMQTTFDWTEPPTGWSLQMFPIGGPDPTVVWRQHFISGGETFTASPEPLPGVDEVTSYWSDRAASGTVTIEFNQLLGGVTIFQFAMTDDDLAEEFPINLLPHIFETQQFNGVIDEVGIPHTVPGTGVTSISVEDADGDPCWLPYTKRYGSPDFPFATEYREERAGTVEDPEKAYTLFGESGILDMGNDPFNFGTWLHDPNTELEPQLAGTSLEPATFGQPVYKVRPDCSQLKLPLRITVHVSQAGSFGSGIGDPIRAPKPFVTLIKQSAHNHQLSPPAWTPPWPYKGEIHAEPAPPGSKLNKPVMGAPGPQVEVQIGGEPT